MYKNIKQMTPVTVQDAGLIEYAGHYEPHNTHHYKRSQSLHVILICSAAS